MRNPSTASPQPALPAFPLEEFEGRLVGLQKNLAARGIAAALLSNASNVAYYSGFRTTIRAANLVWAMLVVPASGEPHAVVSQQCLVRAFQHHVVTADAAQAPPDRPTAAQ